MSDRVLVEDLRTGVEVRQATGVFRGLPLLFGVCGEALPVKALPGTEFDLLAALGDTVAVVTFFVGVLLGFLFFVF